MQCFIHGDSMRNHIVAIIHPDREELRKFCRQFGIGEEQESHEELMKHPEVFKQIEADLARLAKDNNFNSLEKVKANFELVPQEFEVGTVLTPTMKLKRKDARDFFATEIARIYKRADSIISM